MVFEINTTSAIIVYTIKLIPFYYLRYHQEIIEYKMIDFKHFIVPWTIFLWGTW